MHNGCAGDTHGGSLQAFGGGENGPSERPSSSSESASWAFIDSSSLSEK